MSFVDVALFFYMVWQSDWTRLNERFGIWFSIILGALGLSIYPFAMIVSTSLQLAIGKLVFVARIVAAGLWAMLWRRNKQKVQSVSKTVLFK